MQCQMFVTEGHETRPSRLLNHESRNRLRRSGPLGWLPTSPPLEIRACTSLAAPGSSSRQPATCAIRRRHVDMVQVTMYLPGFSSTAHETAPPSLDLIFGHNFFQKTRLESL